MGQSNNLSKIAKVIQAFAQDLVAITIAADGSITILNTLEGRDIATDGSALDLLTTAISSAANSTAISIDSSENVTALADLIVTSNLYLGTNLLAANFLESNILYADSTGFIIKSKDGAVDFVSINNSTGDITLNNSIIMAASETIDGRDISADGALLDTAVQEGDTSTASMQFVIDEDTMASDLATKVPTQQSVKKYVDDTVASNVSYQSGYNASTNTPNLDTAPAGILRGYMYAVEVAGTAFFTVNLEVGDVLIAEQDDPTLESHWTVLNKNLDAASIKISYESNADTNEYSDSEKSFLAALDVAIDSAANAIAITIDSNENVGIGVTPEAWDAGQSALQIGLTGTLFATKAGSGIIFSDNAYFDGAWKYITTNEAANHTQNNGTHTFQVASSGTEDTVISWTTSLTLDNSGNATFGGNISLVDNKILYLGTTNDARWLHSGSNAIFENTTGILYIREYVNGGTINLASYNSSGVSKNGILIGGATPYVQLFFNGILAAVTELGGMFANHFSEKQLATTQASAYDLNFTNGSVFEITMTGDVALTFSNIPITTRTITATLILKHSGAGRTPTFPASVKWDGGTVPTWGTTAGNEDVVTMFTYDSGTTWRANLVGQNYA